MAKQKKTNVMRILDKEKIDYTTKSYTYSEDDLSGIHAAAELGMDPAQLFKTLVGKGKNSGLVVFCIPSNAELDMKKAAFSSGNKNIELVHVKDLFGLTGYIRGGCSPIGMKKAFPTYIHLSAKDWDVISISAGQRGQQVRLASDDLIRITNGQYCDLTKDGVVFTGGHVR